MLKNKKPQNPEDVALPGITATLNALIRARPPRHLNGFAPAGRVATHQWGNNPSAFKGRGMEFAESRVYQAGDDVKNIDWRVTARTGKTHTKLFQEERERPIYLLVDMRTMMHFGTRKQFKSHLAALVAAQLAWVGHDGGDRVGGLLLTRDGVKDFRAARTRRAVLHFLEAISTQTQPAQQSPQGAEPASPTGRVHHREQSLSKGIHRLRKSSRPGALVFIISDFHDADEQVRQELVRLAAGAHVTAIDISDAMDAALPHNGGRLSDGTAALTLSGVSSKHLDDYATRYRERLDRLQKTCVQHHITLHCLQTSDSATQILHAKHPRGSRQR